MAGRQTRCPYCKTSVTTTEPVPVVEDAEEPLLDVLPVKPTGDAAPAATINRIRAKVEAERANEGTRLL